jgi:hypothetical protein
MTAQSKGTTNKSKDKDEDEDEDKEYGEVSKITTDLTFTATRKKFTPETPRPLERSEVLRFIEKLKEFVEYEGYTFLDYGSGYFVIKGTISVNGLQQASITLKASMD